MTQNNLYIGIDPGKDTGIALLKAGRFVGLQTLSFWPLIDYVSTSINKSWVGMIVIEISGTTHVWHGSMKNARKEKAAAIGQNVGAVRREGELLLERFQHLGYPVKAVDPPGKLDEEGFGLLTGCHGIKSQHQRDAGLLAWNAYKEAKLLERVI